MIRLYDLQLSRNRETVVEQKKLVNIIDMLTGAYLLELIHPMALFGAAKSSFDVIIKYIHILLYQLLFII